MKVSLIFLTGFLTAAELPHSSENEGWQKIASKFEGKPKVTKKNGKLSSISISVLKGHPRKSGTVKVKLDDKGHVVNVSSNVAAFTNEEFKYFAAFAKLKNLSLWHNGKYTTAVDPRPQFDGSGVKYLKKLEHLESINLAGGSLDDNGLRELAALPHLKYLGVWHIQGSNEGFKHLMNSKSLKGLRIGPNWIKRHNYECLEYLAKCPNLESIKFGETWFTYEILQKFLRSSKIKKIDLGNSIIKVADVEKLKTEFKDVKFTWEGPAAGGKALKARSWLRKEAEKWIPKEVIAEALKASE